ncbi:MAG: hypothetical protein ACI4EG_03055 [Fusicatenibacter sp.]
MRCEVSEIFIHDTVYEYLVRLVQATGEHQMVEVGISRVIHGDGK